MKMITISIILSFLIAFLINSVFLYNKTSYLLVFSIFVFNIISVLFFVLELEFIAITFSMIYVGGIAVMFLFLIMVVDVNIENVEGSKIRKSSLMPCMIISILSTFVVNLLMLNFDVYLFNIFDFMDLAGSQVGKNFLQHQLWALNSLDIWILSIILFKSFYLLLILIAMYLFVAIIVALIFCSNVFEKNLVIRF